MAKVNEQLAQMHESYLFSEVAKRVAAFSAECPGGRLLRLGVGDVTRPIAPCCVEALKRAAAEMGEAETFHGYPPGTGEPFLKRAILLAEYAPLGVLLDESEIFISDGAKSDAGALQELFAPDAVAAVCDPVYPVYWDANVMAGRRVLRMCCCRERGFCPEPPDEPVDFLYLCSPNNPTGAAMTRAELTRFVEWAREHDAAILFDAAYRDFVTDAEYPKSVFEIEGAKEVAIEMCSFSKGAGFTGLRCAWTAIPHENRWRLGEMWARRQAAKFNGVSYPVQRAAEAALSAQGVAHMRESVRFYLENAAILRHALENAGLECFGGANAPYIWTRCPAGRTSWAWFDWLLRSARIVCTPGAGFGACGEGYVRFSAFAAREDIERAAERIAGLRI